MEVVAAILEQDLPPLLERLEALLATLDQPGGQAARPLGRYPPGLPRGRGLGTPGSREAPPGPFRGAPRSPGAG